MWPPVVRRIDDRQDNAGAMRACKGVTKQPVLVRAKCADMPD
jgi:hypothetical protein